MARIGPLRPGPALGEYEWRLLRTPGFEREFLVNLGTNITWAPVDYWPGSHGGPSILIVNDNDEVWVGTRSSEGPPNLIRMTMDGRKLLFTTGTRSGIANGMRKVVRGGSFRDPPRRCRSAFRLDCPSWQKVFNVGFRVVCPAK